MKKVLVTGGTGYIGSHTVVDLLQNDYEVVIVDNLSNSEKSVIDAIENLSGKSVQFIEEDLSHHDSVESILSKVDSIFGIIHFAALKSVEESTYHPLMYFDNNLNSTINALKIAEHRDIKNFIFSSSCTVYGSADTLPVSEDSPMQATESPYGSTKVMGEHMISDMVKHKNNLSAILLRYFNPAGAHESAMIGESPRQKATNLVPIITETAIGKRKEMSVFGTDYDTRDGSCIRDYIHVMDLARAHTLALEYSDEQLKKGELEIFNLGIGKGVTVIEAIQAFLNVTGENLNYKLGPARPGDVPAIYADNKKAADLLGWNPTRNINDIMLTAWNWEKARTSGVK